jgi:hypothetical protein
MPRNGSGVYSLPAGLPVNGETSDATDDLRTPLFDLQADANAPRPVVAGGTGAADAATARANLGVSLAGLGAQASDPTLTALAAYNTNGLLTQTAADTFTGRTITQGTGITVTNGNGVAGNPTIAVTGNLSSLAGLSLEQGDILYATGPNTVARLSPGTSGQVLQTNGVGANPSWVTPSGGITYAAPQASTSGTSIDFTGIPATATRVCVTLTGVSVNALAELRFQLGDSGGIETTGYTSQSSNAAGGGVGSAASTSGFDTNGNFLGSTAITAHGRMTFTKITGDTWVADGLFGGSTPGNCIIAGSKTLSAALDRVRITTVAGTAAFDAGTIGVSWE